MTNQRAKRQSKKATITQHEINAVIRLAQIRDLGDAMLQVKTGVWRNAHARTERTAAEEEYIYADQPLRQALEDYIRSLPIDKQLDLVAIKCRGNEIATRAKSIGWVKWRRFAGEIYDDIPRELADHAPLAEHLEMGTDALRDVMW